MRKRLVLSAVIALLLVAVMAIGVAGSGALYSDTETSDGNTYTAGTLDLAVDGNNGTNTVKFTVTNYPPQSGPNLYVFKLDNLGSLPGFIDLHSISVVSAENGILEPETEAGDTDEPEGELEDVMKLHMFIDEAPSNGWFGGEDTTIYGNSWVSGVGADYDLNLAIASLGTKYITTQFGWWSTPDDNKAMGDSFTFNMTFQLAQTAGQ